MSDFLRNTGTIYDTVCFVFVSNVYVDLFFVNFSKLSQEEYDSIQTQLETTLEVDQRGHPEQIFKVNYISFCFSNHCFFVDFLRLFLIGAV